MQARSKSACRDTPSSYGIRVLMVVMAIAALGFGVSACGSSSSNNGSSSASADTSGTKASSNLGSDTEITLGDDSYPDTQALNSLSTAILQKMGYKVALRRLDTGIIYASLARGDLDAYSGGYLPATHANYWSKFGSKIDKVGPISFGSHLGIAVPNYMTDVQSIPDLAKVKGKLGGKIAGSAAGGGVTQLAQEAVKKYGLAGYTVTESSDAAESAQLKQAIAQKKPLAFVAYVPNWWFGAYPIRFLDDPLNVYPKNDGIYNLERKGFAADAPDAAKFFQNFKLAPNFENQLMSQIHNGTPPAQAAQAFLSKHPELVKQWMAGIT